MTMSEKRCVICKQSLPWSEFNRRARSTDGLQVHCRECNRKASRAYYQRNRKQHQIDVASNRPRYIGRNRQLIIEHLLRHPCVDCGECDPRVLEFDHVRGNKVWEVGRMAAFPYGVRRLRAEIEKCDVRCVNCHRRRSQHAYGWWRAAAVGDEETRQKAGSSR